MTTSIEKPHYSIGEEIANCISHGVGALLSVAGLTLLLVYSIEVGDISRIVSFSVYGVSLILMFLISTLYHAFTTEKVKATFKLLDHCAIYLLIAGTYTPLLMLYLPNSTGYIMLVTIWTLAVAGISFKLVFKFKYKKLSLATYILMGWLSTFVLYYVWEQLTIGAVTLLALGGLLYTIGTIFYSKKNIPFNHAIWHVFVFAAASSHYFLMFLFVLPFSSLT